MGFSKRTWGVAAVLVLLQLAACVGTDPLVGSNGLAAAGASDSAGGGNSPGGGQLAQLGEPCVSNDEYFPSFPGYDANEVNLDDHAAMCSTNLCLTNHFQGRASCPYGQVAGSSDCLVEGSKVPVSGAVQPQLVARQTAVASICSCHCAGAGPGPYCTCPDSMQCEHLVDDLGIGDFAGSYCIPKGSQYDPTGDMSVCSKPNCGDAHPY